MPGDAYSEIVRNRLGRGDEPHRGDIHGDAAWSGRVMAHLSSRIGPWSSTWPSTRRLKRSPS